MAVGVIGILVGGLWFVGTGCALKKKVFHRDWSSRMKSQKHNDAVRQAFTQQADRFAANPLMNNSERLARLVNAVNPPSQGRVLDVATGPGFVAEAFISQDRMVIGVDVTRAPFEIAIKRLNGRNPYYLNFQLADVSRLPFAEAVFDVVVSRFALHHMEHPKQVLKEMARVCRTNGVVAVEDIVVSEHPRRAAYQNRFEKIRDPSHTKAQRLTHLLKMFTAAKLEVENVLMGFLLQEVDTWLANAHTRPSRAFNARRLIERDAEEDLSGTQPFRDRDGQLKFSQRTAIIVGRKLCIQLNAD